MTSELGYRISMLLKKNGLSQRNLAEKVGITEVSISRYVNGNRKPRDAILKNIAQALHTTPTFLLATEDVAVVVRCKDCKYNNSCMTQFFIEDNSKIPFDRSTFFCADGVKQETQP